MERLQSFPHLAMWAGAIRAETVGRVRAGFSGKPAVHYAMVKRDMERLRTASHLLAKMHIAAGATSIIPGIYGMPYSLGPDQIDLILDAPLQPKAWTSILSHLFGGCVMGTDPKRAVCGPDGKVYGYENLVISDASALPTTLGVNPQHTIMAVSRLRAEQLLDAEA